MSKIKLEDNNEETPIEENVMVFLPSDYPVRPSTVEQLGISGHKVDFAALTDAAKKHLGVENYTTSVVNCVDGVYTIKLI